MRLWGLEDGVSREEVAPTLLFLCQTGSADFGFGDLHVEQIILDLLNGPDSSTELL
jgi:hypothetical protein